MRVIMSESNKIKFDSTKINNALNQNYEYEVRFGSCKESIYINGISTYDYNNLITILNKKYHKYHYTQHINTKIYNNSIRLDTIKTGTQSNSPPIKKAIQKNRLDINDNFEYSYREAISEEKEIKEFVPTGNYTERNKVRRVYTVQECIEIHLTEVYSGNRKTYELELEVVKPHSDIGIIVKDFVTYLLKILQGSEYLVTNSKIDELKVFYKKYFGSLSIYTAQPETVVKSTLNILNLNDFALTYKIDGFRQIIIIDSHGFIYNYYWNANILRVEKLHGYTKEFKNCIIDAEKIKSSYYFIDLLVYENKDIRNNNNYLLKERLSRLKNIVDSISSNMIYAKQYFFNNEVVPMITNYETLSKEGPVEYDGMIFTPINEPYPKTKKQSTLLKWKPHELNTIDLQYKKESGNTKEGMYYQIGKDEYKQFGQNGVLTETELGIKTKHQLYNNMIYECSIKDNNINVIRFRLDKKYPNFKHVVESNYESIKNPILVSDLKAQFSTLLLKSDEQKSFQLMRKLHNYIKRKIIVNNINDGDTILDIGIGKGGDIPKYLEKKVSIIGYDINEEYLTEAKRRIKFNSWDKNHNIKLYNGDVSLSCSNSPVNNSVDVVNMQFSIQFFFESQEKLDSLMKYVYDRLKVNGKFIISILDGYRVFNLLKENNKKFNEDGVNIESMYNEKQEILDLPLCGNKVKTCINCETITNDGVIEYLVNYSEFIKYVKKYDMEVMYSQNYNNYYKEWILNGNKELNDIEITYSNLHRVIILRKKNPKEDIMTFSQFKRCYKGTLTEISSTKSSNSNYTKEELISMKLTDIKEIAKQRNIKISGKKIELIDRILNCN